MDFIDSLPIHQGQTVILVIVILFLKAAHVETLPTHFSRAK